jgi:dTDP-4-dehydrorhamnose reductase
MTNDHEKRTAALLTGAAGLLGHWLLQSAPQRGDVVAMTHRRPVAVAASVTADLREPTGVAAAVAKVNPTLVVHAAYANDRESIVDATRNVVDAANAVGAHVLFISTDAVFLGDGLARDEQSVPDATWDYGRWKATAESIVLDGSDESAIVRLPLLVSIDPDDHVVREIRSAAANGMRTRWFTDEMRRPTFASDVAAAIWRIASLPAGERRGCWHLAGAERLSRLEIARRMVDRLHLPGAIIEPAARPDDCDRSRDIAFTDARARASVGWSPSPVA